MRSRQFTTRVDVINGVRQFFNSQSIDFYNKGIQKLVSHWQKVIQCDGNYFDE